MTTTIGSGLSSDRNTARAAREATLDALKPIGGSANLVFAFAGPDHDLAAVVAAVREAAGAAEVLASSTAGEFNEKSMSHGGVAVLALRNDALVVDIASARKVKAHPVRAADDLCAGYADAQKRARARGLAQSISIALIDGLAGTGDQLVTEMLSRTRTYQQIVGGAAADEGRFASTSVANKSMAANDAAVVAHVFGDKPWGVGVGHGLRATTDRMTVTRADGVVLYEINGRPAFEAYEAHARGRGITLTAANAGAYMIANEIGVYFLDDLAKARAPLGVRPDGALSLAAPIDPGASICILDGDPASMIEAARSAARAAKQALGGAPCAGALVFDCICRGIILDRRFMDEVQAIGSELGDVPLAGFLTYGEIARHGGRLSGWHNATAVVVAIPA